MGDNIVRHLVAIFGTVIVFLAYYSGYISSKNGWWWTSFGLLIIYGGIYKIIDKD